LFELFASHNDLCLIHNAWEGDATICAQIIAWSTPKWTGIPATPQTMYQ
jgi:hypothetical protein